MKLLLTRAEHNKYSAEVSILRQCLEYYSATQKLLKISNIYYPNELRTLETQRNNVVDAFAILLDSVSLEIFVE